MESLKFEIASASQAQLQQVREVLATLSSINECQISPYSSGYLVSLEGINMKIHPILTSISSLGIEAERLFEE
ncbi:hypothetical protein [Sphingobacterium humi]|uniref:Copper chaperone n=1 Tax=Sphingobacterium humi TaxID=1796905 RepID=A0A6N8L299_9SPHI|nr:hypothetical protein [Sphingobacterium humi]MVZ63427.1 hypothetical protein [Sphingobacterium humi]